MPRAAATVLPRRALPCLVEQNVHSVCLDIAGLVLLRARPTLRLHIKDMQLRLGSHENGQSRKPRVTSRPFYPAFWHHASRMSAYKKWKSRKMRSISYLFYSRLRNFARSTLRAASLMHSITHSGFASVAAHSRAGSWRELYHRIARRYTRAYRGQPHADRA